MLKVVFNSHDIHALENWVYAVNVLERCTSHVPEADPVFKALEGKVSNTREWVDYAAHHAFVVK